MGAFKCYNDQIIGEGDNLLYMFECKVCHERWFSSFCQCPKCNRMNKFKILSGEQAVRTIQDNQELYRMAVYGLLNKEYK
jgi:hypothetical protein